MCGQSFEFAYYSCKLKEENMNPTVGGNKKIRWRLRVFVAVSFGIVLLAKFAAIFHVNRFYSE